MKLITLVTTAFFAAVLFGCGPQGTESAETATQYMPSKSESTEKVLVAYEHVRSQLANDEAVSEADLESLAAAARTASEAYSGEGKTRLEELASSAESGASQAGEGLAQAREAFGEISRHLIALLSADSDLAKGRYVFACPMAKSYPKWVQQSETVSNPYLGPDMATCGTPTEWQP